MIISVTLEQFQAIVPHKANVLVQATGAAGNLPAAVLSNDSTAGTHWSITDASSADVVAAFPNAVVVVGVAS